MTGRALLRGLIPVGLAAGLLLLSVGCARNRSTRAFGAEYAPRPAGAFVKVTFDESVNEDARSDLGVMATLPPPAGRIVGSAYGEAFRLEGAIEALLEQARKLGGTAVHVEHTKVTILGCSARGTVYRLHDG